MTAAQPRIPAAANLILPVGVVVMLAVILIPLPTLALDLLITLDVAAALLILLVAMYVPGVISFSAFPTTLLLMTLFRLALNIASTRLILLNGQEGTTAAGQVIRAFGEFVVGGSFVVGLVIFLVLLAVQFVVINHGATRISEVTARFTLDALPGKQMAIDADLNAGLINEQQALARREKIAAEAEFYGSMDGAIRFTQRDAVAAIIITTINIVAGLIIGVAQHDMVLLEAGRTYTILTVGDGLVSAVPALFISIAGGIITTRASDEGSLGDQMFSQLFLNHRPLAVAAGALGALALIPGLPTFAFLVLATGFGALAIVARRRDTETVEVTEEAPTEPTEEPVEPLLTVDPLCLELGFELVNSLGAERAGGILDKIKAIRRQFATDCGFIVPPVRVRDNLQLENDEYRVLLRGVVIGRGRIPRRRLLAIDPGGVSRELAGETTTDPAFGIPALWIEENLAEQARAASYTVVDPPSVVSTHLMELVRRHAAELLGREDTRSLLDHLAKTDPKVVEELLQEKLSLGEVQQVLRSLLREGVPVRDLRTIAETLADMAPKTRDPDRLVEAVRRALGRALVAPHLSGERRLAALTLSSDLERELLTALEPTEEGGMPPGLEPRRAQELVARLTRSATEAASSEARPVVIIHPRLRTPLHELAGSALPHVPFLSTQEIPQDVLVQSVAQVS